MDQGTGGHYALTVTSGTQLPGGWSSKILIVVFGVYGPDFSSNQDRRVCRRGVGDGPIEEG